MGSAVVACGSGKLTGSEGSADTPGGAVATAGAGGAAAGSSGVAGNAGTAAGGVGNGDPLGDPGVVALRRLNRSEYNNTVRDLLGTSLTPADAFPADDLLYGFDNIGDALNVSTLLFEGYESAARTLVDEFLANPGGPAYARFIVCDVATGGATCANQIVQSFAERAWRRPVGGEEIAPFAGLFALAASPDEGLRTALGAVLTSPAFMFRVELDPSPLDFTPHALGDYELASRLSYLLWDSMPDDALFDAAAAGSLQSDAGLATQLERMLTDGKAQAFIDDMAGMWLHARKLDTLTRDYTLFPSWDDSLRVAMQQETRAFFQEFYDAQLPVQQMLTANFTFANQRLAEHYGLSGVTGDQLQRVELTGNSERLGLLTQGTFLTATSRSTRTAPVIRGKWVLDQIMCTPPPPPPADVVADLEGANFEGLTLRERLNLHKDQGASCFSCHSTMDPIGLGLENYDAIGSYRTEDPDGAIDPSGELPGTPPQAFSGALELAQILGSDPRVERCVTQQIMTYGLGMKPAPAWIDAIRDGAAGSGVTSIKSVLRTLVMSSAFRTRRAAEAAATVAAATQGEAL